mmetsp:Transcript_5709/g.5965  ORF Transcript_5709/g.5965 Transcript_5709/m.5965 type:complete len:84 (+) Transcript_5709:674-925(+)
MHFQFISPQHLLKHQYRLHNGGQAPSAPNGVSHHEKLLCQAITLIKITGPRGVLRNTSTILRGFSSSAEAESTTSASLSSASE